MRALFDAIFAFIGATSLTDQEFSGLGLENALDDLDNYTALSGVLDSRESVSSMQDRLRYYYLAKGVSVPSTDTAKSNILIGSVL